MESRIAAQENNYSTSGIFISSLCNVVMEVTGNSVHLSKYVSMPRLILSNVALTPLDIKVDKLCCYGFTIVFCTNIGTYQADGVHRFVKEGEQG